MQIPAQRRTRGRDRVAGVGPTGVRLLLQPAGLPRLPACLRHHHGCADLHPVRRLLIELSHRISSALREPRSQDGVAAAWRWLQARRPSWQPVPTSRHLSTAVGCPEQAARSGYSTPKTGAGLPHADRLASPTAPAWLSPADMWVAQPRSVGRTGIYRHEFVPFVARCG